MKLLFTRHGQTEWNVLGKVQGRADISLNEKGKEQARKTAEKLQNEDFDLIICSPLKRARETAEIINIGRNVPVIYDETIAERDFGEFEGVQKEEFDFCIHVLKCFSHNYWMDYPQIYICRLYF